MVRSALACAVCALVLLCLGGSARGASGADPAEGDLCVARDWLAAKPPMSLTSAAPRLEAPPVAGDRDRAPAPVCVSGADPSGECAIDGPGGSGPDPRPIPHDASRAAGLAAAGALAPPPARALPRTDATDRRLCPGHARGIDRPPRTP